MSEQIGIVSRVEIASVVVPLERARSLSDVAGLAASIAEIGLLQPIVVGRDLTLIAGLHRLRACQSLGWSDIPAISVDLEGLRAELAEIDENLIRNDLTVLERGEHLARRKRIYEFLHPATRHGAAKGRAGGGKIGRSKDERISSFANDTAEKIKLTGRTIQHEVQIAEKIAPDVKETIRGTDIADSKTDLLELARLPADKQRAVAARLANGGASTFKAALIEERRAERTEKIAQIAAGNEPIDGVKLCPVVYADPPWEYENTASAGAVVDQYPTMSLEAICALKPPATEDAILFLWATSPLLLAGLRVIESWGFTYKGSMVWDKGGGGVGSWVANNHEFVLIATRGEIPPPLAAARPPSVIRAPRSVHSRKPNDFALAIECMYPTLPRVEMFARAPRDNWIVWGNQAA